jgi:hypothetical protein
MDEEDEGDGAIYWKEVITYGVAYRRLGFTSEFPVTRIVVSRAAKEKECTRALSLFSLTYKDYNNSLINHSNSLSTSK